MVHRIVILQGAHEVPAEPSLDESTENTSSINKVEDVLIKVIRVLANLSISEDVGPFIAASPQCITNLLHIIGISTPTSFWYSNWRKNKIILTVTVFLANMLLSRFLSGKTIIADPFSLRDT